MVRKSSIESRYVLVVVVYRPRIVSFIIHPKEEGYRCYALSQKNHTSFFFWKEQTKSISSRNQNFLTYKFWYTIV